MEAFHRALLDTIEVAHPTMMSFVRDLWQVASLADRDAALTAAGIEFSNLFITLSDLYIISAVPNVRPRYGYDLMEDDRIFKIVSNYDTYPSNIDYLRALSLKPKSLMPQTK